MSERGTRRILADDRKNSCDRCLPLIDEGYT
jgi:hypothetical protein